MIKNNHKRSPQPPPPPPILIPNPPVHNVTVSETTLPALPSAVIETNVDIPAVEEIVDHRPNEESIHDNPDYQMIINKLKIDILLYIRKINYDIGYYWWKAYIYSAFWNNISTPINLVIMILTALTTGHSATGSIVSETNNTTLGLVTLIISIFNTFFRPAQQMNESKENMTKWYKLGIDFEKIYYSKFQDFNVTELSKKVEELQKIFNDINELKRSQDTNFIIDIIFLLSKNYCIKRNLTWIPKNNHNHDHDHNNDKESNTSLNSKNTLNPSNDIIIPISSTVSNTIPQIPQINQSSNQSNHSDESIVNVPISAMDTTNLFARKTNINIQCRDIMV